MKTKALLPTTLLAQTVTTSALSDCPNSSNQQTFPINTEIFIDTGTDITCDLVGQLMLGNDIDHTFNPAILETSYASSVAFAVHVSAEPFSLTNRDRNRHLYGGFTYTGGGGCTSFQADGGGLRGRKLTMTPAEKTAWEDALSSELTAVMNTVVAADTSSCLSGLTGITATVTLTELV